MNDNTYFDREELRDALRQAAIHSPHERTQEACDDALKHMTETYVLRAASVIRCEYKARLRRLVLKQLMVQRGARYV